MKNLKRIFAFLLVLVLISLTPEAAFADAQQPIKRPSKDLYITYVSDRYNIGLNWDAVTATDQDGNPTDVFYDVKYRNLTKNTAELSSAVNLTTNSFQQMYMLDNGSIYRYTVVPSHIHYISTIINGLPARIPQTMTTTDNEEVLFLTDIEVQAIGGGNEWTVTWDNPTYGGKDLFYGYRIYYAALGDPSAGADEAALYRTFVDVTKDEYKQLTGNKVQYSIPVKNPLPGRPYTFMVEPLRDKNVTLRGIETGKPFTTVNVPSGTGGSDIRKIAYTKNQYRVDNAYIEPSLTVTPEGVSYVKLEWNSLSGISSQEIKRVEIYSDTSKDFAFPDYHGSILGGLDSQIQNTFILPRPTVTTYYRVRIVLKGKTSAEVDNIIMETKLADFNPSFVEFAPYMPTIDKIEDNRIMPLNLNVTWLAFTRKPFDDAETSMADPDTGYFLDRSIEYDIWVSDSLSNFDNPTLAPIATLDAADLPTSKTNNKLFYSTLLDRYSYKELDANGKETGLFTTSALVDNKIYYVKIRAKRKENADIVSKEAFYAHYIPPLGDLPVNPQMLSKPPLRIRLDDKGIEVITSNTIDIEWDTKWFEALDEVTNSWSAVVSVSTQGALQFVPDTIKGKQVNLFDQKYQGIPVSEAIAQIKTDIKALGINATAVDTLPVRLVDLRNAQYEYHVVEYDPLAGDPTKPVSYEAYYTEYLKKINPDPTAWELLNPNNANPLHPTFTVTKVHAPTAGNLVPNKPYVIFLRPFIMANGKKTAYFPAFVVGTTLDVKPPIDITPIIPILEPVSSTDMSVTVRWNFIEDLRYELAFSDDITLYPDGGVVLSHEEIIQNSEIKKENDINYIYLTINDLFPETNYHLWIRASAGNNVSSWSNPVMIKTKEIETPKPPRSLGPVTKTDLDRYNKQNGEKFVAISKDYMILQWMRDMKDTAEPGTESGGSANGEVLSVDTILDSYILKVNNLVANRLYYIRAKTVLTVVKDGMRAIRKYSYIVQMADNEKFEDAYEFEVPPLDPIENEYTQKRKESDWCITIHLKTSLTGDEYDGDKDPSQYPLPDTDFEITYDPVTDSLTYRFRTNERDAKGNDDNGVDQRFISKLFASKAYIYRVDLSSYEGRIPSKRNLLVPYSIIQAFDERQVALRVISGNLEITLPPESIKTFMNMQGFDRSAHVRISTQVNPNSTPPLGMSEYYISDPQSLSIQVVSSKRTEKISQLRSPIHLGLWISGHEPSDHMAAYYADGNSGGWQATGAQFDDVTNRMLLSSYTPSTYSAIARAAQPQLNEVPEQIDAYFSLTKKLIIEDLPPHDAKTPITANELNNLMIAVARGRSKTNIETKLSAQDFDALGKARLLVSGTDVTRELGISALVKLYEFKTKQSLKNYFTMDETPHIDISEANAQFREPLLKASTLGFFGNDTSRPTEPLTLGETFMILNIILQDAY